MIARVALALALASCARMPSTVRPALPEEHVAIAAARAAFEAHRGPLECSPLADVEVAPLPFEQLQRECYATAPVSACVYTVERHVFAGLSTLMFVRDDVDERTHARLIIHEASHVLRACWVYEAAGTPEYLERMRSGSAEGCEIHRSDDAGHCEHELWHIVAADAFRRWEASR